MELEKQVVSLELAKRLKDLLVPQTSVWCWLPYLEDDESVMWELERKRDGLYGPISCFTVAELGEMLPSNINHVKDPDDPQGLWLASDKDDGGQWCCSYGDTGVSQFEEYADTEADARAKMLIYLLENNLMEPYGVAPKDDPSSSA